MRILNAYITRDYLTIFVMTLIVFLFVMAIGNIFKVIDLFSRGVSGIIILQVFSCGIPFSLIFAIPMSVLATAFLQYSRMAGDREIVAMKACGINIWQIVQPPILISTVLCLICIYINCSLAPDSHFLRRAVLSRLGVETPLNLLDEGRFIRDFPGFTIYIGRKDGYKVSDIVIYQFGDKGLKQTIRATSGTIKVDEHDLNKILITLFNVRIDQADEDHPDDLARSRRLSADEYPMEIDVTKLMNRDIIWKKRADLTMTELISGIRGIALFSYGDFTDMDRLANKLKYAEDPLFKFIRTRLSKNTRRLLAAYDGSKLQGRALKKVLIVEFNKLISYPDLYSPERFSHVRLAEKTRNLLNQHPKGSALIRLNRMLLEDACPNEITRNNLADLSPADKEVHRMSLLVEASTRLALSFSCYAFVLLGMALGIKIHRKESSIGIAVTLAMVFTFYFFIIIADSLVSRPEFQPYLVVWIPFFASEGIGYYLLRSSN